MGDKWVDANKGDMEKPDYRCRSVAKEIEKGEREDLFAAKPPLEAKKILISLWASVPGACLDFGGVVPSCGHARARGMVCVELSRDDFEEGKCGFRLQARFIQRMRLLPRAE